MFRLTRFLALFLTSTFLLLVFSTSAFADDEPIIKTFCSNTFGFQNLDQLKSDLLTNAKREAVNELFGELITASTAVEDFVVTSDQIRTSSIGFVRVEGNVSFYNGDNLAEVCATIHAYATEDDRKQFIPVDLNKRHCVTDATLTTSQISTFAKQEAVIQALVDYNANLASHEKNLLLPLLQRVEYLESGFVPDTETYCVRVEGEIIPIEILAFLDKGQGIEANLTQQPGQTASTTSLAPTNASANATLLKTGIQEVACNDKLAYGQFMECEIDDVGEEIVHQFSAEADDAVRVAIVKTRGDLYPGFTIHDADGNIVKDNGYECSSNSPSIIHFTCRVPKAGTYSLRIYSHVKNRLGKYLLYFERMNNPVGANPISYGQSVDSEVERVAEAHHYTFEAEADDAVRVTLVRTRGEFYPGFTIRDEDGNIVKDDGRECNSNSPSLIHYTCRVPKAGTYSLRIYSHVENRLGKYLLHFERMNNPMGASSISYGQSIDGEIERVAEAHHYTFEAEADDAVRVTLVRTRGEFYPGFTIRDADGNIVKDDGRECSSNSPSSIESICRVPETGTYSLRIYSHVENRLGKYTLKLDKN